LNTTVPTLAAADKFTYDPANPVLTRGGNLCCSREGDQVLSGAFDQSEIEKRSDVLIYTTQPFDKDFEVTGPLRAEIYISSSAEDTDITAKLVDVWPNGFAQNLADGIQRLRYRSSSTRTELMQPGTIYKIAVDMGATSNVFRQGHRLRLELSSSNFPHFDRNLNTNESPEKGGTFIRAENKIYHDPAHASAIILPVIPVH
jgi:putative CocE/NonD family hydrolase